MKALGCGVDQNKTYWVYELKRDVKGAAVQKFSCTEVHFSSKILCTIFFGYLLMINNTKLFGSAFFFIFFFLYNLAVLSWLDLFTYCNYWG